jgi:sterol desaturase/sphingolipid hydroxylase (fatty acid hydroxylase superfamily)
VVNDQRSGTRGRRLASYLIFPALMLGPPAAGWLAFSQGAPQLLILPSCLLGCLGIQLVLERLMPYHREWNARRRVGEDLACMGLNAITHQLVDIALSSSVYVAAALLIGASGPSLWPASWPLLAQLGLVVLVADLGHYLAHRLLHRVAWLWAFHQMHHSPNSLDSLNFFRMHPFDIVIKSVLNVVPLMVLGAPADVLLMWMIASGISAGSVNHANIEMRTRWLDEILSTPNTHRFHHSRRHAESACNLGNITMIYDRLFGTYCRPADRTLDEIGEIGGARPLLVELLQPLARRSHP